MPPLIQVFAAQLGILGAVLIYFLTIAYGNTPATDGVDKRFKAALSEPWFGAVAAGVAGVAVIVHFYLLWNGLAFVFQSGSRPWIHTAYGLAAVLAIALSLCGYRHFSAARPWLSLSLVLTCIMWLNMSLSPGLGPKDAPLSQDLPGTDKTVVRFAQERLKILGCFEAAYETEYAKRLGGDFDGPTASAIVSFQQANGLLDEEGDRQYDGQIRPDPEFRLLARPFPGLGWPQRCAEPSESDGAGPGG